MSKSKNNESPELQAAREELKALTSEYNHQLALFIIEKAKQKVGDDPKLIVEYLQGSLGPRKAAHAIRVFRESIDSESNPE